MSRDHLMRAWELVRNYAVAEGEFERAAVREEIEGELAQLPECWTFERRGVRAAMDRVATAPHGGGLQHPGKARDRVS